MRAALPPVILLLSGCLACETSGEGPDPTDIGGADDTGGGADTDPAAPEELCNGLDDDGDGRIDEGSPDIDADGIADCMDSCALEARAGEAAAPGERCVPGYEAPEDVADIAVEWQWTGLSTSAMADSIWAAPVVGHLTDDNGDGRIDTLDVPDVAFTACEWVSDDLPSCAPIRGALHYTGSLVVLDGATGAVHFEQPGFDVLGPLALGDIDADGVPEVLAYEAGGRVVGLHGDGTESFRTTAVSSLSPWSACLNIADLDGDGQPELITHNATWDGLSGRPEAAVLEWTTEIGQARSCPVADIDLDGQQEWFPGATIAGPAGKEGALAVRPGKSNQDSQWVVPLQADADPEGEIAYVGGGGYALLEHDGSLIRATPIEPDPGLTAGPPCVGDFDGDGAPEIGLAWGERLRLLEVDGTEVWAAPIDDGSGHSGCSGFDLDADGALEMFYADEESAWIFDGASGSVLWQSEGRTSGTGADYPVIADVDGDGSAEVLLTNNRDQSGEGWEGLVVLGHASSGWAPAGPTWNTHDYATTNVEDDGGIPATPASPFGAGVWRARHAGAPLAALSVAFSESCVASCEDDAILQVALQVRNAGYAEATTSVGLYRDDGGSLTLLQRVEITVPAGWQADEVVLDVPRADLGSDGLVAWIDPDGALEECDDADDIARWDEDPC